MFHFLIINCIIKLIKKNYLSIIDDVLSRGAFIMQKDLFEFENNLKKYLGCKYAIGVADGTAALTFSLKSCWNTKR